MIQKQTVYLPKDDSKTVLRPINLPVEETIRKEGYFFTPEQLNEYTANVIKQTLETAVEKAEIKERKVSYSSSSGSEYSYVQSINKKSITNTFEETFKNFKI